MKSYLLFCLKILLVLATFGALGFLITWRFWVIPLFTLIPVILYFGIYKGGQWIRHRHFKKKALPKTLKTEDGFEYKDLNGNGKLDVYENPRETVSKRVEDLLSQMSVEEKAGLMFSPQMNVVPSSKIATKGGFVFGGDVVSQIKNRHINTFCLMGSLPPKEFARYTNEVQKVAAKNRLGIPVTFCSDPRHVYIKNTNPLTTQKDEGMSAFPSSPGMGATNDPSLMRKYGKVVNEELTAVGIRFALHPCADTSTEPRWPRAYETFGDDSKKNGQFAKEYILGMQGESLSSSSVACCLKHFPGGGPQENGDDPHFAFGKNQVYPGHNFEYHLEGFLPPLEAGVAAVMPYYGIPKGLKGIEEVGFNFNKQITTDLLKDKLGFKGIVHSDYSIIEGIKVFGLTTMPGRAWGIEKKNVKGRLMKALDAGVDQFGGENCSKKLARLVRKGLVSEERLNQSCRKILELKFRLGLFDNPYVDEAKAETICKAKEHVELADEAMRKSLVLLKKDALPLKKGIKIYVEGFAREAIEKYAPVVANIEKADFALLRLDVPKHKDRRDMMASMFESGSLDYDDKQKEHWDCIMKKKPTIVVVNLNRPAILKDFKENSFGILGEFNCKVDILLAALFGEFSPSGSLPYALPKDMDVFLTHSSDVPLNEEESLYPRGYGLTY